MTYRPATAEQLVREDRAGIAETMAGQTFMHPDMPRDEVMRVTIEWCGCSLAEAEEVAAELIERIAAPRVGLQQMAAE